MIVNRNFSVSVLLAAGLLLSSTCMASENLKQKFVQHDGIVPKDGYVPKRGFVPNEDTAINVGIAVLTPIYGEKVIASQKPFKARLVGKIWVVTGALPVNGVGGSAEIDISKRTGEILRVVHGK